MADRSLRGMRLGALSLQSDVGVEYSPRKSYHYKTPDGELTEVTFAAEVEPPQVWECRTGEGALVEEDAHTSEDEAHEAKPVRTHWDMLMERRKMDELEEILQERIDYLHARRKAARELQKANKSK